MKGKYFLLSLAIAATSLLTAETTVHYEEVPDLCSLEILTPSLKERKTAKIRLDNGLEAYLISDPKATQSAAALSMEAGSWSDSSTYPGIAHFTEHLLFMGSKTYPQENGYEKIVKEHGGIINAFTANDFTTYMFTINHDTFTTALDYFAHMFIDPLFTTSGIGRELNAVHQEYSMNLEHDLWRAYMVEKATGNPDHPNCGFSIGNRETLSSIPREAVIKWWEENYSSDKAHLVLYSSLPLDELKMLTADLFSKVPQKASSKKNLLSQMISSKEQQGHLIAIEPVQDIYHLAIRWELPEQYTLDLNKTAHQLISYALKSHHRGSLYAQLKQEDLIEDLYASMDRYSKESAFFELNFLLTPKGVKEFETVIERCYQALNQLKSIEVPRFIFNELKTMASLNYMYQSQEDPFHYVRHTASSLIREPLETFPEKLTLPKQFNTAENRDFLNQLTSESAMYYLIAPSKLTEITLDRVEKWFGVKYAVSPIDQKKLYHWNHITPNKGLALVEPNPFIPKVLPLLTTDKKKDMFSSPLLIASNPSEVVYFWEDTHYRVPDINWTFKINSSSFDGSAKSRVLGDLFEKGLDRILSSTLFAAQAAGLDLYYYFDEVDFVFNLKGYRSSASDLLRAFLTSLNYCPLTKKQFELERTLLGTDYANFEKAMPFRQAMEITKNTLFSACPKESEKLAALKSITYEEFTAFTKTLFDKTAIQGMLIGNLTESEAKLIASKVKTELQKEPLPPAKQHKNKLLMLPEGSGPHQFIETTKSFGNAALLAMQHGTASFENLAAARVLENVLEQDFFDTLRTKQQTAYLTRVKTLEKEGKLVTLLGVQSTTHTPEELIARFELFLEAYTKDFETALSEGRFEEVRNNLITKLQNPLPNLTAMSTRLCDLAFIHKGDFNRIDKCIAALKNLTYAQLKTKAYDFFSRQNRKRLAISLSSAITNDDTFRYETTTLENIKNNSDYVYLP